MLPALLRTPFRSKKGSQKNQGVTAVKTIWRAQIGAKHLPTYPYVPSGHVILKRHSLLLQRREGEKSFKAMRCHVTTHQLEITTTRGMPAQEAPPPGVTPPEGAAALGHGATLGSGVDLKKSAVRV